MKSYVDDLGAVGRPARSDVEPRRRRETLLRGAVRVDHVDRGAIEVTLIDEALPVGRPRGIVFSLHVVGKPGGVGAHTRGVNFHEEDVVDRTLPVHERHPARSRSGCTTRLCVEWNQG